MEIDVDLSELHEHQTFKFFVSLYGKNPQHKDRHCFMGEHMNRYSKPKVQVKDIGERY